MDAIPESGIFDVIIGDYKASKKMLFDLLVELVFLEFKQSTKNYFSNRLWNDLNGVENAPLFVTAEILNSSLNMTTKMKVSNLYNLYPK